jgi:hypothetical protein
MVGNPWLALQLQNIPTFIFGQEGSPAQFHCQVRQYLNTVLPARWIGRRSGNGQQLMLWPRGPLTLGPVVFFCLGIRPTIATWTRWPKGTDHCSSEEYRCTRVDAYVAKTWISYRFVPCHPWCTHRTSLVAKKNFQFSCGCEQFHAGRSFGFRVINVCNRAVSPVVHTSNTSRVPQKTFPVFLWLWTIPLR